DAAGRYADVLHVVRVHVDRTDSGLVIVAILARTDLLPLLRRATGVHQKTPGTLNQRTSRAFERISDAVVHLIRVPLFARISFSCTMIARRFGQTRAGFSAAPRLGSVQ